MVTANKQRLAWRVISASVRGSSHVRTGLPNQDACDATESDSAVLLAIADGHGGSRHFRSQLGSALAVQSALAILRDMNGRADLQAAARRIEEGWRIAVTSDIQRNPFSDEEIDTLAASNDGAAAVEAVRKDPVLAYGATLLAAAATDRHIALLQIGDGDILAVSASGETSRPIAADERLIGNQTTSLCQSGAWKDFRTSVIANDGNFPSLLLISTDGYANSFRSEEDFLKIGGDYLGLIRERGLDAIAEELPSILTEASQHGSGDDITLGILSNGAASETPVPQDAPLAPQHAGSISSKSRWPILLAVLLGLVAGTFAWIRFHRLSPHPHQGPSIGGGVPKSPPPGRKAPSNTKPGNAPPAGKEWTLDLGHRRAVPLAPGAKISVGQMFGSGGDRLYAEVKDGDGTLTLVNDSGDIWTVFPAGEKTGSPVAYKESLPLDEGVKVLFRGNHGVIGLSRVH